MEYVVCNLPSGDVAAVEAGVVSAFTSSGLAPNDFNCVPPGIIIKNME